MRMEDFSTHRGLVRHALLCVLCALCALRVFALKQLQLTDYGSMAPIGEPGGTSSLILRSAGL